MTYFKLYQQQLNLKINTSKIKKKYYDLCKEYHPDNFLLQDEEKQSEALEMTSKINEGYKILCNENLRLQYFLKCKNIIIENDNYKLSNTFLMEMMELNEQIMEAKQEDNKSKILELINEIKTLEINLKTKVNWVFEMDDLRNINQEQINNLKEYYYQKKYLARLQNLIEDNNVEI